MIRSLRILPALAFVIFVAPSNTVRERPREITLYATPDSDRQGTVTARLTNRAGWEFATRTPLEISGRIVNRASAQAWLFDVEQGTFKVIELTGFSSDGDRLLAEYRHRGSTVDEAQIRAIATRAWQRFESNRQKSQARRAGRQLPTSPPFHRAPDGAGGLDEPYCYGDMHLYAYYEDIVQIDVASTDYWIEFDTYVGSGSNPSDYKECWAKSPGLWPPPANTDWDVVNCSSEGYGNSWGFDRAVYSWFINWDWWDNDESTEVFITQGLQYTNTILPNYFRSHGAMGEDHGNLHIHVEDDPWYICWGSGSVSVAPR